MLTFKEFPYERPQLDKMLAEAETIAQSIENAKNAQTVFDGIKAWESLQGHFMTMANVAHIRYTVDTTDPFYLKEKEYLDQAKPRMMTAEKRVYAHHRQLLLRQGYRRKVRPPLPKHPAPGAEAAG